MRLRVCWVSAILFCCPPCPGAAAARSILRVCADPNNLPFSNNREEGFENKIASVISDSLGEKLSYTWWVQRDHLVRNTLAAERCDLLLGVPADIGEALATKPYYKSTYVFVYRRDSPFRVQSLNDEVLEKLRIGVHIMGDNYAPPAAMLSSRGLRANIKGYSMLGAYGESNPPARLIEAVEKNDVDVAIVWGPLGGFFARHQPAPLNVVPVQPDHWGQIPFTYSIAMAVRENDSALRDRIDEALSSRSKDIEAILRQYGVP
jgi:mxaJ protein